MNEFVSASQGPPRRLRRIAITLGFIGLGILGGLVVFALTTFRRPPPPLTAAAFEAAAARWESHRPANYEMELNVSGRQSGTMHVIVINHEPTSVVRGDVVVPRHTWDYWTVEGLFEIIRTDLEGLDQPERAFGAKDVSQLVVQAEFDANLGYPRRYRRAVLTTGDAIEWEITQFENDQ
jgi:hypothetical protein